MEQKLLKSTQQSVKFFEKFIRKDNVQDFIIKLRKNVGIPKEGIIFQKEDKEILLIETDYFLDYIPPRIFTLIGRNYKEQRKNRTKISVECTSFLYKYKIHSGFMGSMFRLYFIFNKTLPYYPINLVNNDLAKIDHLPSKLSFYKGLISIHGIKDSSTPAKKISRGVLESLYNDSFYLSENYPVVIYLNPNISQRQLIDFISKNWDKFIKYKKNDKLNINSVRNKRKQETNDFIYEHGYLSLKEIGALGLLKFGNSFPDQGGIGKILSLERKNRK